MRDSVPKWLVVSCKVESAVSSLLSFAFKIHRSFWSPRSSLWDSPMSIWVGLQPEPAAVAPCWVINNALKVRTRSQRRYTEMHLRIIVAFFFVSYNSHGSAQSLPGNVEYKKGDPVPLYANKVGPFANPSEQYEFYTLPFCAPKVLLYIQGPLCCGKLTCE